MPRNQTETGVKVSTQDLERIEYMTELLEVVVDQHPDIDCDLDACKKRANKRARERRSGRAESRES